MFTPDSLTFCGFGLTMRLSRNHVKTPQKSRCEVIIGKNPTIATCGVGQVDSVYDAERRGKGGIRIVDS